MAHHCNNMQVGKKLWQRLFNGNCTTTWVIMHNVTLLVWRRKSHSGAAGICAGKWKNPIKSRVKINPNSVGKMLVTNFMPEQGFTISISASLCSPFQKPPIFNGLVFAGFSYIHFSYNPNKLNNNIETILLTLTVLSCISWKSCLGIARYRDFHRIRIRF